MQQLVLEKIYIQDESSSGSCICRMFCYHVFSDFSLSLRQYTLCYMTQASKSFNVFLICVRAGTMEAAEEG
jgi:hypothetical protein